MTKSSVILSDPAVDAKTRAGVSKSREACRPVYRDLSRLVCRQNTIGSVEGELRNHEIREIQVDALLKLDRAAKNI